MKLETITFFPLVRPKLALAIGFVLLALMLPWIGSIQMDFSSTVWFRENDPHRELLKDFEKTFGNDESVILLIELHDGDVFEPRTMKLIEDLSEEMWQIPTVVRVESVSNYHWSYAEGDELITEPFIPDGWVDAPELLAERRQEGLEHSVLPGVFFSRDGQSALIYGRMAYNPTGASKDQPIDQAMDLLREKYEDPAWTLHALGQPILSAEFQQKTFRDIFLLTPILIALVLIYLYWSFRSLMGVLIPFSIIVSSLGFTAGLTGLLGAKVNSLTFILPSILIAISIADSIHLLTTFFDQFSKTHDIKLAAQRSLIKNLGPIVLTSISTAIGFFSLTFSEIVPVKELGILAGFGTVSAMLFSYFWVVPLLLFFVSHQVKSNRPMNQRMLPRSWVSAYLDWLTRWRRVVLAVFMVITTTGIYLGLQNRVDSNPYKYFKEDAPISYANNYSLEHYGGVGGPEIIIDSGEVAGAKKPEFLQRVESFQSWLNELPYVNRVMSVIDILKEMNKALFQGKEEEYRIHPNPEVIAQELFLYTIGLPQGMDINNRIDLEERRLRLSLLWSLQDSKPSLEAIELIKREGERRGLDIQITGKSMLFQQMNEYVVFTFFSSMGAAALLISFILFWVYGSAKMGVVSLIPNAVPIFMGAGLLTLLSKPIDIGCAIVASVTLGIAVDDTIHFLSHYKRLRQSGMDRRATLEEVLSSTGLALIITTVILASCFGLFVFASLTPNINFGILCSFVLTMAIICDLVILPAIFLRPDHKSS